MFIFTLSLTVYTCISGIVLALVWCVVLSPVDAGRCSPAVENHLKLKKTTFYSSVVTTSLFFKLPTSNLDCTLFVTKDHHHVWSPKTAGEIPG